MRAKSLAVVVLALGLVTGPARSGLAASAPPAAPYAADRMPPRVSLIEGQASFWRPGAADWVEAQINTALAPEDELATGPSGRLEVQVGPRAFLRLHTNTQVGLEAQEPDVLQFSLTAGDASLDLRGLDAGQIVEVDTPNAAFSIAQPGYYRVTVAGERTSFVARRGGRATVAPAAGSPVTVTSSDEVVIEGSASLMLTSYVAPPVDEWDQWNYARTDELLESVSSRYVSPGTYGVDELDRYGTWRDVRPYGPVWVPLHVAPGWVPYSTGAWVYDPYYGWTWVDTAPWGWAPYHHGRWVFVHGYWAWAPGPVAVRAVYAPALVAFYGGPLAVGGPVFGWVALGWGEPLVPWWGPRGHIHVPSWRGWGGPRVVNNLVITHTTVVTAGHLKVYRNAGHNGIVVVPEDGFGRGHITHGRLHHVDPHRLHPIAGAPGVARTPASFVPSATRDIRPADHTRLRRVVTTRPPRPADRPETRRERPAPIVAPKPQAPKPARVRERQDPPVMRRPPFGPSHVERPDRMRSERSERSERRADVERQMDRGRDRDRDRSDSHRGVRGDDPSRGPELSPRTLPGEPANRLAPYRSQRRPDQNGRGGSDRAGGPGGPDSRSHPRGR
jgi:hypothetical protein